MLHKFVAASQAQSRSWKTYMKRDLPSPVAFFGANLLLKLLPSLVSYMPLAHALRNRKKHSRSSPYEASQHSSGQLQYSCCGRA